MLNPVEIIKILLRTDIYTKKNKNTIDDLTSYLLIQDLAKFPDYFPTTTSSLRFHTLAVILNDIILNKRQSCIEFGAGVSTIVIAKLIKNNNLNCNFSSVEDDVEWFRFMESYIVKNNLKEHIDLIYAPLEKTPLALKNNSWYSLTALNKKISGNLKFDLAIIDGPGAWKPEIRFSRYTAVPYLINKLTDNFSIYLDDVNREGEKKIMSLWNKNYKMKFTRINNTSAVYIKGNKSNILL